MDFWADAYLTAFLIGLLSVGGMLFVGGMHHGHRHGGGAGHGHGQAHGHGHAQGGDYLMVGVMRLLWRAEAGVVRPTDPSGTIARVIAPISAARMGEIVFSREDGARQALAAKLDQEDSDIERDAEVVVMRVERGTAYVTRLAALAAKESK